MTQTRHPAPARPAPAAAAALGAAALLLCLASGAAQAIRAANVDGVPVREPLREPVRDTARDAARGDATSVRGARAAGVAATSLELVRARLDAVNLARRELTLGGHVLGLHPTALRVVSSTGLRLSGADALRPGMHLRFAREAASTAAGAAPTADTDRRIVLIYIEP